MKIFIMDISSLKDENNLLRYMDELTPERAKRVEKLVTIEKKAHCAGSELLLKRALDQIGYDKRREVAVNEKGKPYLKDGGIHFNISHSGDFVVCAVGDRECGVDIEKERPLSGALLEKLNIEKEAINKNELATEKWVLFESLVKVEGTASLDGYKNIKFKKQAANEYTTENEKFHFKIINILEGYKISVCQEGIITRYSVHKIEL